MSWYESYFSSRSLDHSFQDRKQKLLQNRMETNNDIDSDENVSKTFLEDLLQQVDRLKKAQRKVITPEEQYRTARKIDWDAINKKRKETGNTGEEMVVFLEQAYLRSIGKENLANRVEHCSKDQGDGLGYDIRSFFEDGREKYIEVKSTTGQLVSSFYLSRNEFSFLKEHSNDAFVYKIKISQGNDDEVFLRVFRSEEVVQSGEIIPIQYFVKMKQDSTD